MLKIGTDIVEIERIQNAMKRPRFLKRYFTTNEIKLISMKGYNTAAANWCAKEAVSKALCTGFSKFGPIDIEILRDDTGAPYVILYKNALNLYNLLGLTKISISLSHSKNYAVATVILY